MQDDAWRKFIQRKIEIPDENEDTASPASKKKSAKEGNTMDNYRQFCKLAQLMGSMNAQKSQKG